MKIAMLVPDDRDEHGRFDLPEPYFGPAPTALLEGLAGVAGCEAHIVCCSHQPMTSPAKLASNIFYHCLTVPGWGWLKGGYFGCTRAIRRKLLEIQPDIVHGQGTERYCALAAVRSGFPNVVTIHGNMRRVAKVNRARPFSFEWLSARLEAMTLPRAAGVFCNSAHTEEQVRPLAKKTWRVPNALRKVFFRPPAATTTQTPPVLLNIGFIGVNKSQIKILEMAERLHRRGAIFQLQFIGKSDDTAYGVQFCDLVRRAETQGYAVYPGPKSADELIRLMDSASGLVHAPIEEAFGLVVAEGLARNLKFFGAKVGGIIDIAQGAEGADVFDPGNMQGMEDAIFSWLRSGAAKPASAASEMFRRYHPDVIAGEHIRIYRDLK